MLVYSVTIFVSALLLFLVQPLIGRVILPWFGGSSAVWSTAMFFFQLLLLAGYAYSHLLVRRLDRRRQGWVHLGVLALSVLVMGINLLFWSTPITPGERWAPIAGQNPLVQELLTLAVSVGLPYLVLATTSPLLQSWFSSRYAETSPYPLYALSNAGSILALAGYPLLLEPLLTIHGQATVWSLGYLGFVVGLSVVAWSVRHHSEPEASAVALSRSEAGPRQQPWWRLGLWLAFSTVGSVLLLGTTSQITQNVTAVPLLWVGPLALYLLTFVVVFSGRHGYSRWYVLLLLVATQAFGYVLPRGNALPLVVQLSTYALVLFAGCMVSHGELARLRPQSGDLTVFYLAQGFGGALGGVLVNVAAPAVFAGTWEFPVALLACWAFAGIALALDRQSKIAQHQWVQIVMVVVFSIGILSTLYITRTSVRGFGTSTLAAERNFYGVLRIQATTVGEPPRQAYRMVHGTTIHGIQYVDPGLRDVTTSYYSPSSGAGIALSQLQAENVRHRVGVLGLGAGTLAAYGREGDTVRFYEIDPEVIRYAKGEGGYFSYLRASSAEVEIVPGDARLSLSRELSEGGSQAYDLLAVDVFSGDALPVHLLTLEAFELYLSHLVDDGVLAVHISTTYLDLVALLATLADRLSLSGVIVEDVGDGAAQFPSRWVILNRDSAFFEDSAWHYYPSIQTAFRPDLRPWSDSYSTLIQVIR